MDNPKRHHSFFWPTVLIGVGVVLLLINFGVIEPFSINTILQFWPILLVVVGLEILFGQRYAWVGSLIGILALGGVIAFLVLGPKAEITTTGQTTVDQYTEPLGEATSAYYIFETGSEPVQLYALSDETQLIDATIAHQGTMNFTVTGSTAKTVHLYENASSSTWLNWDLSFENTRWNIGISPTIATDISLDGGSGSINADLSGIQLDALTANLGSGSSNFIFPESAASEQITLDSGSGSVSADLPANTTLTVQLESGSGSVTINLPTDAEVRIEVMDSGSGSLSVPSNATRVSGDVETGAWESAGYASAEHPILIQILDRGSGSISIH